MSDKIKQLGHPLDLPDEYTKVSRLAESGVHGAVDRLKVEDESDDDVIRNNSRTTLGNDDVLGRSGGLGIGDLAEEQGENVDPEYLILRDEYVKRDKGDKRSFQDWVTDQSQHNEIKEKRKDWALKLDLDKLGYESPRYDRFADLMKIWSKSDTKVTFRFGEVKEDDKIIFEGQAEYNEYPKSPRDTKVVIKREDFNQLIKDNGRDLEIRRPRGGEDRNSVMFVLEHVRFHESGFKGKEFEVVYPDIKLESDLERARKKLMDHEFDKAKDFLDTWKSRDVKGIGFRFKDNRLDIVALQKGDGSQVSVSALELRSLLPNIWRKDVGNKVGISILGAEGQIVVTSESSEEKIGGLLKRLRIDGVKLSDGVSVKKSEVHTADIDSTKVEA